MNNNNSNWDDRLRKASNNFIGEEYVKSENLNLDTQKVKSNEEFCYKFCDEACDEVYCGDKESNNEDCDEAYCEDDCEAVSECENQTDSDNETTDANKVKENKIVVFISGNTDISEKDYMQYYMPLLQALQQVEDKIYYVMSDDTGAAELTQMFLSKALKDKTVVSIFGTGETPNMYLDKDYIYIGGFKTLEERDAAMTVSSNKDLHIVLGGKGNGAIKNNICRRLTPKYDYKKFLSAKYNIVFWSILFGLVSTDDIEKLQDKLEKENN